MSLNQILICLLLIAVSFSQAMELLLVAKIGQSIKSTKNNKKQKQSNIILLSEFKSFYTVLKALELRQYPSGYPLNTFVDQIEKLEKITGSAELFLKSLELIFPVDVQNLLATAVYPIQAELLTDVFVNNENSSHVQYMSPLMRVLHMQRVQESIECTYPHEHITYFDDANENKFDSRCAFLVGYWRTNKLWNNYGVYNQYLASRSDILFIERICTMPHQWKLFDMIDKQAVPISCFMEGSIKPIVQLNYEQTEEFNQLPRWIQKNFESFIIKTDTYSVCTII